MKKSICSSPSELLLALDSICKYICRNVYDDPEMLLDYVLKKIAQLMTARAGNIRLFDKSSRTLILRASYGVSSEYRKMKLAINVGDSVAGHVFGKGKVYAVEDLRKNHLYKFPEYALKEGVRSLLSVPLSSEKKVGVLSVYFAHPRRFNKEEIEFLSVLSGFIVNLLMTHTLQYKLRHNFLDIAKALVVTLEEKDTYTKGHSERVGQYAMKIGERLKLPKRTLQVLEDFSVLHDIGKVVVDASILTKSGSLNAQEWRIIKKHPEAGARMIMPVDGFTHSIPLVKHHHERIDGKGYPDGLCGKRIPLLARILAVADAFDAMTSPRSYKKTRNIDEAKNELIQNAGRQFDEKIVKVMIDLIDSREISLPK